MRRLFDNHDSTKADSRTNEGEQGTGGNRRGSVPEILSFNSNPHRRCDVFRRPSGRLSLIVLQ